MPRLPTNTLDSCEKRSPMLWSWQGPDHLHADQTVMALEQGCHVLVEKPLATTVADAQRILDAEAKSGRHVMTDQTMRYLHPCTKWH